MIPLAPPVSMAKAKLCCKTKCAKMGAMVKPDGAQGKHCHHQKGPFDCCKENCAQFVTYEKPDAYVATETQSTESLKHSPVIIWLATIDTSTLSSNLISRFPNEIRRSKPKDPPIYVIHSSFLI
jgi:hypothetical protein